MVKGHKFPQQFGFGQSTGKQVAVASHTRRVAVRKASGGAVHDDRAADSALVKSMVKPSALK